jgi:hypothetical protein
MLPSPAASAASAPPPSRANDTGDGAVSQDRDPSYDDSPGRDEAAPAYTVEFAVLGEGSFGALQFDVTHLGRSGGFIGPGDKIDCAPLVEALTAANYVGERLARIGLISLTGIRMGGSIVRCGFRTREPISPNSFQVDVTDASSAGEGSEPLDPQPTVVVASVTRR